MQKRFRPHEMKLKEAAEVTPDARIRMYDKARGEMPLQFWCNTNKNSISYVMRELARACWRIGYEVFIEMDGDADSWGKTSVRHLRGRSRPPFVLCTWGRSIGFKSPGMARVEFDVADSYMWKDGRQVDCINNVVDLLLTPAESNVKDIKAGGVKVPMDIVPLGVDRNIYKPCGRDWKLFDKATWVNGKPDKDTFVFLCAGMMQERKGFQEAIAGFVEAFKDTGKNVALLIKNVPHGWGQSLNPLMLKLKKRACGLKIGIIEEEFSDYQMARLLSAADCFVNTHKREGFGLMPLQAMSCGTVPIVTNYDGPKSYLTDKNAILLEPTGEADQYIANINGYVTWATIEPSDIATCMKEAFNGGCDKRKSNAMLTAIQFSWEETARKFVAAIEKEVGPVKKRFKSPYSITRHIEQGLLTVAIPVRNSASDLERAIKSLQKCTWENIEVMVFDDASDEDIGAICNKYNGKIKCKYIRSDAWVGEGAARDWMMHHASGEYIYQTDADVEFIQTDWIERMVDALEKAGNKIVLHPTMLQANGKVWSAGGCYYDYPQYGAIPAWHVGADMIPDKVMNEKPIAYAPFVGWFGRTREIGEFYDWIGGYFPTIFVDVDMAFWLKSHGFEFWNVKEVQITHYANSFTKKQSGEVSDQHIRFTQHAEDFKRWWAERIEHELALNAHVLVR